MDNILLMSLGSRGDVEPFLALGEYLQELGHEIAFCFPEQFQSISLQVSPSFYPMTPEFLALMTDPDVKQITGQIGSPLSRIRTMLKLLGNTAPIQHQLIRDQKKAVDHFKPDHIIFHIKCVYPIIAAIREGQKVQLLSPVPCLIHAVNEEPSIGFGAPKSPWWNKLTYKLGNQILIKQSILSYGNSVAKHLGIKPLHKKEVHDFLFNQLPVEYSIDQRLFPRPDEWPEHVQVTTFRERNKSKHWIPSKELEHFLKTHPNPLYLSFGSMINSKPQVVGADILAVSAKLNIPVLINKGWGGIEIEGTLPDHIFVVSDIPYDWLFKKVCAVVHHGGSGTTHSALRFQKKQLIIPHIGDQFLWSRLVQRAGYGPKGFPIKEWSRTKFQEALEVLLDQL